MTDPLAVDDVTLPQDSITKIFLAAWRGADLYSGFKLSFAGGVSFRSIEGGQDQVNPDFQGSLNYALGPQSSIVWNWVATE